MKQQDRSERGDLLHALVQREVVDGRELVDPRMAHEGLEARDTPLVLLGEPFDVPRDQAAPESEVDERRRLHNGKLGVERRPVDGDRDVVERHVDVRREPASSQRPRSRCNAFPVGAPRVVEVDMRIDAAGKDMEPGAVNLLDSGCKLRADVGNESVRDADIHPLNRVSQDDVCSAHDEVELSHFSPRPREAEGTPR